ncbi:uncharacterized protein C11orf16 homolog isoform X2 [Pipistrellus kuhlii]|uniref:uncharacterized protein C11orf16 homolog isoform X2 n=1 Tax=Pipistrellus kuhlii TaxID=59472 RepID=UPI00174F4E61|nr:uncharacterized protein C11orf16 homolog isoform X2 [Pipistrellus kuhlii]
MAFPSEVPTLWEEGRKTNIGIELGICQVLSMYHPLSGNRRTAEAITQAEKGLKLSSPQSQLSLSPELRFPGHPARLWERVGPQSGCWPLATHRVLCWAVGCDSDNEVLVPGGASEEKAMEPSGAPGGPLPKYCSVATALEAPAWAGAAPSWNLAFSCPLALQAPWLAWHSPLTRCASYQPRLPMADPALQGPGRLGRVGDAAGTWVLARRGPDGLYHRAQIKPAPELERQGALLVEFEAPLVTGPQLPAPRQSVVLGEDVVRFSPPEGSSLQPGDTVLAPWEPDGQWYGPATVSGLEARGPQRASEEEITVHFWDGRTATVPRGGVWGVAPAVWKKAVERLHGPFTSRPPATLLWAPCCSLLGPGAGYVTHGLPLGTPFLCPPCHPRACCQLLCQGCPGCCSLAGPTWWPLSRTLGASAREHPEAELKPLPLEAPKKEKVAVLAPMAVSSSSSSSSEGDLKKDLETGLPQRLVVDSTVTSDPVPPEKTRRRQAGLGQPEWRYWKRNGPEPLPGKPGKRCCSFQKEEKGHKQQRGQMAEGGHTKEPVLEVTNAKPLQTLPDKAEHGKLSQGTPVTRQRHRNALD